MSVIEALSDDECYLYAILTDPSGLDLAEFSWYSAEEADECWRAWPFQWRWFRNVNPLQIDQCSRSVGKSLSIKVRAFAFPFIHPQQEMVITAPELVHLHPITGLVENVFLNNRLGREMLPRGRNAGITHRPFQMDFVNGSRILGRIPQRDGKGMKGCLVEGTMILTETGYLPVEDLRAGDRVLTHKGRWVPVERIEEDVNDCYEVRGQSSFPMTVSCDHRFLGAENTATSKQKRRFEPLRFHDVEFLKEEQVYWATPTVVPSLPVPELELVGTAIPIDRDRDEFWWLVGRYLADGYLARDSQTQKAHRVRWVVPPGKQDALCHAFAELGLRFHRNEREHSSADTFSVNSAGWYRWLEQYFGRLAGGKRVPAFALGMQQSHRKALLDGYLAGDGHFDQGRKRWTVSTASKELALGIQLLAQTLGFTVNCDVVQPKVTEICGVKLKKKPQLAWRLQILDGHPVQMGDYRVAKVKSVTPAGRQKVFNPIVAEDHSYVSGSIMSHNVHPLWLELDEGQDYPDPGWVEVIETLKRGTEGAVWRAHGVTRGVRDYFYKFTQPESGWTVHRLMAMHRPNWSNEERQEKIEQYGSREHPDYRRNVLGLHGDATNPMFVLHRLMATVDSDETSDYNTQEYRNIRINSELLNDTGQPIQGLLNLTKPEGYAAFWCGMDVGFTNHPSEILVFGEQVRRGKPNLLKLLVRVHLERISNPDQVDAILHIFDFFRPKAFAMDKTGVGLPLFQDLQGRAPQWANLIKGYNFSSKILVDFDTTVELDEFRGDPVKDAGILRNVLEYASDKLREFVDGGRIGLPWDRDLIGEFQGQTYTVVRDSVNMYGRKEFNKGKFHALDAARMAILGYVQWAIEEMMAVDQVQPILDVFLDF